MARKTVLVCDSCSQEIEDGKGAVMRANPVDGRRQPKQADLCDNCFTELPGVASARRGRPKITE